MKTGEVARKTDYHPTLDIDVKQENPILRKEIIRLIPFVAKKLTKDFAFNHYTRSPSQGVHFSFKSFKPLKTSKLFYCGQASNYEVVTVGDLKGQGGYVLLPLSQNYDLEYTKAEKKSSDKLPFEPLLNS